MTLPLTVLAGFSVPLVKTYDAFRSGGATNAMAELTRDMTGYDPNAHNWQLGRMKDGLLPVLVGGMAHRLANRVGINRMLSAARVPLIRI